MSKISTFLLVVFLVFFASFIEQVEKSKLLLNLKKSDTEIPRFNKAFLDLELEAKSVYVFDALTGIVLYAKNENVPLPLASLTKLMTTLVALESVPKDSTVTIKVDSLNEVGDSGLFLGEKWNLDNLAKFTLTSSSNDGAHAIATSIGPFLDAEDGDTYTFIDAMNLKAKSLNLSSTHFFNETGLDVNESIAGGYGSAKDVTMLMLYLWKTFPWLMQSTSRSGERLFSQSETHDIINTNKGVNKIPGVLLSKTGFTDIAGGNLSIAFDSGLGHPVFITVLGSTFDGRINDVEKLVTSALETVRQTNYYR